ncbi:hypothetical protein A2U01_0087605, partial [Trifolium medium]|nr:hypothetical protein [Trifolium medium]
RPADKAKSTSLPMKGSGNALPKLAVSSVEPPKPILKGQKGFTSMDSALNVFSTSTE